MAIAVGQVKTGNTDAALDTLKRITHEYDMWAHGKKHFY